MMYGLVIVIGPTGATPGSSPRILANPSHVWSGRESKGCVRETCPITIQVFFRVCRLVDRMSSGSLHSRHRILQFIASLEQQIAMRVATRSRKSSKKKALSTLFSWTAAADTRTGQLGAGEPRPPYERPIRRGWNAGFDSSSRAGPPSSRRACAFCDPSRFIENRPDSLHREDLLVTPRNGRMIVSMMPRTARAHLSGPRQERPGACGPIPLPQGRWLQGRDRPGAP